ncbi:ATP-binding protein [Verminephrobacter eiseniae]|uniref:ATP-binding protein n=1 Tax=Verminephrobacter eiseniae TaxID=364317 RepID=UPI00223811CE|nr:ATP-binding protein [Verminephrobacter eiseniae]MCW5237940.1 ATP-binding protein [Verminephrobacter eiseniae]
MNTADIQSAFPRGVLRPELFLGVVASVTARSVGVNLSEAGKASGSHFSGGRYGRGEVGEFVLIEGQQGLLLGRISEVRLRELERRSLTKDFAGNAELDALGLIQLLGSVAMDSLRITAGVDAYPRLGDRIYAAPHQFIAMLPQLMEPAGAQASLVVLSLGAIDVAHESLVTVKPERLFGRHCAILGATGGGKSWTTAKIIEECLKYQSKLILIDATGEYRSFSGPHVVHCHLGEPVAKADNSIASSLPPTSFIESDFVALFEPAGKVQGPKMRAAIRSLRLAQLKPELATNGVVKKIGQSKQAIEAAERDGEVSSKLDNPSQKFDVIHLVEQIQQECVWPTGGTAREPDNTKWGNSDDASFANCLSLVARINGVLTAPAFASVFHAGNASSLVESIEKFLTGDARLLRICLSGVSYEYHAREIIANVIGRYLLKEARAGKFSQRPVVTLVDEAHNFLGRHIGAEDYQARLDAFEIIAKEGRKYGLTICLASQRPRDITEGVLSQLGTLIVHRLTNDKDREVVERASGEIDRAASAFLPNLLPGEAAIIGTDFPIPLTIQITPPAIRPQSDGPSFQDKWAISTPGAS